MHVLRLFILIVILALPLATAWGTTKITRYVVGAGGGTSISVHHASAGTAGQPTVAGATSATYGVAAGFWRGPGTVVGIEDPEPPATPLTFQLYQNLPNPVTLRTTIRFDVPENGARVVLRIYNLRGALVRTLADGPQSAGEKRVNWDGVDDRGERSAAGVYLYVLDTPKQRLIRKLTVLR